MSESTIIDLLGNEVATSGQFDRKTRLPSIRAPGVTIDSLRQSVESIKTILEAREGVSGSVLDKSLTMRDLVDANAVQLTVGNRTFGGLAGNGLMFPGSGAPGATGATGATGPTGAPGGGWADPRPYLTTPPTPGGLTATGTFKTVFLTWTLSEYLNHSRVEIWRAGTNSRGAASLVGTSLSNMYVDAAVAVSTTYYYWVRAIGIDVAGATLTGADNAVGGVAGGALLIGTVDMGPLIIEAGNLADGSVTAAKVAALAIDATKFANSIQPITMVTGSFPTTLSTKTIFWTDNKLYRWNGSAYVASVPVADLAGQIANAQIQDDAITTLKIAAGQVTAAKTAIAALNASTGNLNANTVNTAQLVADSVTAVSIAAGQVTAAKTAIAAIDSTSGNLTANSVTATQIAAGQVTAGKLAADSVVASNIQAGAVTTSKMTAGTIDALVLTAGTITAGKLAANSVVAANIVAGEITAGKLAADSVVSANIVAGTIVGGDISGGTITGTNVAADTITGTHILAGSVAADRLTANSITAGQIQAGAIGTNQIAANAITTGKLLVTGRGAALNDDPGMQDITAWVAHDGAAPALASIADGPAGNSALLFTSMGAVRSRVLPLAVGRKYRVSCYAKRTAGAGSLYLRLSTYDAASLPLEYAALSTLPSATGYLESVSPPSTWTRYAGTVTIPSGTVYSHLVFYANYNTTGTTYVQDLRVDEFTDADLIVDGAIIAGKIAAGAIAVGSAAIQNGAIRNALIENLAVDSAKIALLAVGTAQIADGAITNLKVTGGLDASKITVGTLSAGVIGANSIDATKIDTRNLTIKDAGGTVIFGSGQNLDFARVAGSTRPADNATVGADWNTNLAGRPSESAILNSVITYTVNANGSITFGGGPTGSGSVTLSGLGAGTMATISQITAANASTYIAAAAVDLAHIKLASITTLAALSSYLGTVDIAVGGYLRSGQTAWSTGTGFWHGWIGTGPGEPGMSIGDAVAYMRYRPSTGLEIKLDAFTAAIGSGNLAVSVASGLNKVYGSRQVTSVVGGLAPYTYSWTISSQESDIGEGSFYLTGDPATNLIGVSGGATNTVLYGRVVCTVTDSNGRVTSAYFTVTATHGVPV